VEGYDQLMSDPNTIKNLVLNIIQQLVDLPDEVVVDAKEGDGAVHISLRAGRGEAGKIIGKQGRTARCLRTIVSAAGMKQNLRISLDIIEDQPIDQ
jgi:predicted RNA-binding protein YlqC (UPF0109 family)